MLTGNGENPTGIIFDRIKTQSEALFHFKKSYKGFDDENELKSSCFSPELDGRATRKRKKNYCLIASQNSLSGSNEGEETFISGVTDTPKN